MTRIRSGVMILPTTLAAVREIATCLGLLATRGPTRGREGTVSGVLDMIAVAYERDPAATMDAMRRVQEIVTT